jgi:hypothetical protein
MDRRTDGLILYFGVIYVRSLKQNGKGQRISRQLSNKYSLPSALADGAIKQLLHLSFLLNSHYLFGQSIFAQKITLHLRPDFRGRVISFEPGLGQEHLPVSFHWLESARC